MSKRTPIILVIMLIALLSLGLAACEKERPVPTPSRATPAPARGTSSPTAAAPAALTAAAPSAVSGAAAGQATPVSAGAATPMAPTPQPVIVNPSSTSGSTDSGQVFTYSVAAGDTLASIAAKFGTVPEAIAQLNNLTDPNALTPGQQLKIVGTQAAARSSASGGASTYVVQGGDTLASIARRFGTTVAELVRLNSLSSPDILAVGQTLTVPGSGGAASAPSSGATTTGDAGTSGQAKSYVIQSGDTLMKIARKFGVTLQQLQAANKITNPDRIYPGQVLVIP